MKVIKHYFGVSPKNDQDGCMQDLHWFSGIFGYFSVYAIANISSSQIFCSLQNNAPDAVAKIAEGNFSDFISIIDRDICQSKNADIVKNITGKDINVDLYMSYLRDKYTT